jgi:carbonic anhydrase
LDHDAQVDLLCELNVREQLMNVCHTTIVRDAWKQGRELHVHGTIYGLKDGLLKDLGLSASGVDDVPEY